MSQSNTVSRHKPGRLVRLLLIHYAIFQLFQPSLFPLVDAFASELRLILRKQSSSVYPEGEKNLVALQFKERRRRRQSCFQTIKYLTMKSDRGEDEDDGDEIDDNDDDIPPEVDVANFSPPSMSTVVGLNRGRSSPSQRKAMGTTSSGTTSVYVCTNCGSESVKWMGRCPTCREWNTLQEYVAQRSTATATNPGGGISNRLRPRFGQRLDSPSTSSKLSSSSSWVNGLIAPVGDDGIPNGLGAGGDAAAPVQVTEILKKMSNQNGTVSATRISIPGDSEITEVLGGGIMKGSLTLLGGDPGVGKSTLLLQTAARVASQSVRTSNKPRKSSLSATLQGPVWYVSGEETIEQVASRAARLGIDEPELYIHTETHVNVLAEQIIDCTMGSAMDEGSTLSRQKPPSLLIIDSIQTLICDGGGASAAGGITQVRECVAVLLRLAKSTNLPILLVGHVTKSGDVAGPRTVEHMVDCVLYLEGGRSNGNLRLLRSSKNRFGSSRSVGIYEMTMATKDESGGKLLPVSDPSSLLLASHESQEDLEGCAIALEIEGFRALTIEIQALVVAVGGGGDGRGQRTVDGISYSRLQLLLGVLQKYCGIYIGKKRDVYVNVVGGGATSIAQRKRNQPGTGQASDLAVLVALVSSYASIPVRADTAFCAEVGLLGELRVVPDMEQRLQEAKRMGFSRVVAAPKDGSLRKFQRQRKEQKQGNGGQANINSSIIAVQGIEWVQCDTLWDAIHAGLVAPLPQRQQQKKAKTPRRQPPKSNFRSVSKYPGNLQDLQLDDDTILDDDDYYEDDEMFP